MGKPTGFLEYQREESTESSRPKNVLNILMNFIFRFLWKNRGSREPDVWPAEFPSVRQA